MEFLKAVVLAACVCNTAVQSLYFTHMLQLNSYRSERYRKWCRDNSGKLINARRLWPLLLLVCAFLPPLYCLIASAVVLFAATALNFPQKAKKPLVFTARVKRLLVTQTLLTALVLWRAWLLPIGWGAVLLAVFSLEIWAWIGLSNLINTPLEKAVAKWYVGDARRMLKNHSRLTVIGITGSYGKTSTKTFLHALLSARYNVLMTPESFNTTMGVVRTVREHLRPSHEIFIAEMGAKNRGDIREICDLVFPQYGIITSIGEQHLETFRTVGNIVATKFELADALPQNGCLVTCGDNAYIRDRLAENPPCCKTVVYGFKNADVTITDYRVDLNGCTFTVQIGEESQTFTTKLLGSHNLQNLAACIAVAHQLGVSLGEMVYPIRLLKPVEHRLQLLPNGYIDDAYNSNPAGFRSALDVLRQFDAQRVLVTPGMVELGVRQDALNRELGEYSADCCDVAILVGERQAQPLKEGLLKGGFAEENLHVVSTLQQGLALLQQIPATKNRIVLLENDLPDNF